MSHLAVGASPPVVVGAGDRGGGGDPGLAQGGRAGAGAGAGQHTA